MNHFHRVVVAFAMAAALVATTGCRREATSEATVSGGAAATGVDRVTAGHPTRKTLVRTTTQPARIDAFERTPLFAKLAGYVDKVHVDVGDRVKKDQPLVSLRIPELQDEVAQKEALVAQAEAEMAQAAAAIDAARAAAETAAAEVAHSQAGVSRAAADYDRWSAEFRRIEQLAASGSVTEKLVDETRSQQSAAAAAREEVAAAVQSAEAGARQATAMVAKAEADKVAAEARLAVAQADLARARTMLTYATIAAPFDGVVTERSIDAGHFVQPAGGAGAKPLVTVARMDQIRVTFDVPEMDAALVDVGDPVTLHVQALGNRKLTPAVTRTSWSLDEANRSLRAIIDLPNDDAGLRPGMYATAAIELQRQENALALPAAAVMRNGDEAYCWVVESGAVQRRNLELGLRSGPEVEVKSGIEENDLVVLARVDLLKPEQKVEVIAPAAP